MNFIKKNIIFTIVAATTLIASAYLIYMDLPDKSRTVVLTFGVLEYY